MNLRDGKLKHLTLLHLYTDYKITDKPLSEMTLLQYSAVFKIADEIMRWKHKNKGMVVI